MEARWPVNGGSLLDAKALRRFLLVSKSPPSLFPRPASWPAHVRMTGFRERDKARHWTPDPKRGVLGWPTRPLYVGKRLHGQRTTGRGRPGRRGGDSRAWRAGCGEHELGRGRGPGPTGRTTSTTAAHFCAREAPRRSGHSALRFNLPQLIVFDRPSGYEFSEACDHRRRSSHCTHPQALRFNLPVAVTHRAPQPQAISKTRSGSTWRPGVWARCIAGLCGAWVQGLGRCG